MSKVKFQNYSGIKNAKDNPRCIAKGDLKNGQCIVYSIGSDGKEYAAVPTSADEAKTVKHFVWNTIDKPELDNESDFVIKSGEYSRIFEFTQGEIVDVSGDLVSTPTVNIGDVLVPSNTDGKYVVSVETGFTTGLKVTEKTTYGGAGYSALVITQ